MAGHALPAFRALIAIGIGLALGLSAQPTTPRKVPAWLVELKAQAEQELNNLKTKQADAQSALEKAQRAEARAIELNDQQALEVARRAIKVAQEALATVARGLTTQQQTVEILERALGWGPSVAVPTKMKGEVLRQVGRQWVPVDGTAPVKPGDMIKTGPTGSLEVLFDDGSRIQLGPNSSFRFEKSPAGGGIYRLFRGIFHQRRQVPPSVPVRGELPRYQTPTVLVAVRGTEFDLQVDDQKLTHFAPYSGTVELRADALKIDRRSLDRWWGEARSGAAPAPLPEGKLARIAYLSGAVLVQGPDGIPRTASVGDFLGKRDKLTTGESGLVQVELLDGYQATLGSGSQLEASTYGEAGAPLYAFWKGRAHVVGPPAARQPRRQKPPAQEQARTQEPKFLVPNAVVAARGAEFEVSVSEGGLADFLPLKGTLEITARIERLDLEKIKPWWREQ